MLCNFAGRLHGVLRGDYINRIAMLYSDIRVVFGIDDFGPSKINSRQNVPREA